MKPTHNSVPHTTKIKKIPAINQIVIGDVGSGKTIVAFCTALNYLNGLQKGLSSQVAMVAPTEILARQHYQKLIQLCLDLKLDWLTCIFISSKNILWNGEKITPKNYKLKLASLFEANNADHLKPAKIFWLGTHALFYNNDIKPDLVLADEQHRFGVQQRSLLGKDTVASHQAHFISFSATPIPRSLALTYLADLKPHFLERLSGRQNIFTRLVSQSKLEFVHEMILEHIALGRKIFIVCPMVDETESTSTGQENSDIWSVAKAYKYFEKLFPGQVLMTSGKDKAKLSVMEKFQADSSSSILVSTTVIEVGVDVAAASVMIILNAERFGLSALHQIRGRIGRNNFENNTCLLVTDHIYNPRLKYIVESQDGYYLAQKDLELRGAGEMFGNTQSGFDTGLDSLLNMSDSQRSNLQDLYSETDLNLPEFSRLAKYLSNKSTEIWGE